MFLLETTNLKAINTGLQDTLRSGSFVLFTVRKKIDSNLYQISLSGKLMSVHSSNTLPEGSRMRAQVFWVGNRLQLKVSPKNDPISDLLLRSNIILNKETQMIAEGLIRSGMPLLPAYFEKVEQSLRKYKKPDDRLVKILLLLIDKGIPLNDKNISEIFSFSSGHKQSHSNDRKNSEETKKDLKPEDIKEDIKKQIKKTDLGNELLKFFNHRIAKHGNWLIIPLSYSFARKGTGVLKLRLDEHYNVTNLVLSLNDGRVWEFSLVKDKNLSSIKVQGPNDIPWEDTASFRKLKEKLYNIGIQFDDINREPFITDGFTEIVSGKYDSIDFVI